MSLLSIFFKVEKRFRSTLELGDNAIETIEARPKVENSLIGVTKYSIPSLWKQYYLFSLNS